MNLSRRAQRLAESATLRVSRKAAELRAAGREIVDFSAGQPDFPSPAVAVEAARQALADGFTRYTVAAGIPDLRNALARRYADVYGAPWEQDNVVITVGGKAALYELIMTLVDDGDEVVLPTPAWVSFPEQIGLAGGSVITVPTRADESFAIRSGPILEAVTDATRMILVNSPSNPTGGILAAEDLREIVTFCAERGIAVLADETYERFLFDGGEFASAAALAREFPETVIVVGSFSKTYAMTGWRIGYALADAALIKKTTAMQSHVTSNATSFAMSGALAALEGAEDDVLKMLAAFSRRRDYVVRRLRELPGIECQPPAGAFYAFPDVSACFRDGRRGSVEFAEFLLDAGVAVVPGVAFGADDHIRISFACSQKDLEAGLDRIAAVL